MPFGRTGKGVGLSRAGPLSYYIGSDANVSVATPAEPRGEKKKKLFFVQVLGGEKLLKFVEKCQSNIFKRPERG